MKLKNYSTLIAILIGFSIQAQNGSQGPTVVATADGHTFVPSLASRMNELTPATTKGEAEDSRSYRWKREIVPGKGRQQDILSQNPNELEQKVPGRAPDLVFTSAFSGSQPTDPSIGVGPNHVFAVFNTGFAIYDKDGNQLIGQTAPSPAIFPSNGCCDLTVSYDPVATSAGNPTPGRWVISFLGGGAQVAVSDGPDPITAGWNVYNINTINDYQKLSVWSDGYYVTDQSSGNRVYAMERQAMLDGEPAANVSIQGFSLPNFNNQGFASVQVLNISDNVYPGPGNATVVFFQDDAYPGQTDDSIKFWDLDVDFDIPANSVISAPQEVIVTPFTSIFDGTSFANLAQPGGGADIDALQGIIMNQAQYKKFPTYNAAIFNFVIDIVPGSGEQAAIRWYEFRQTDDGQPWTLEQEGTFSDPDGRHFWHGSMMMDNQGNIGMGFSALGNVATGNGTSNEFVSSYYTGRLSTDPSGTMTIAPQLIFQGTANIPGLRYGDYSKTDIDPSDYQTMYFVNEVMQPQRSNVVGRFKIAPDFDNDLGVVNIVSPEDGDLTAPQDVTVTIRNFGTLDVNTTVPVSYSIDAGTPVIENVAINLTAGTTQDYTFTAQGDFSVEGQTYTIVAATDYSLDEENGNDSFTKDVTHIFANDIGVTAITSPTSGEGLTDEDVTILIENFGTATQTGFDVAFTVDTGSPVIENVGTLSVAGGSTETFTFAAPANLSAIGQYTIVAETQLPGDSVVGNNETMIIVDNLDCNSIENDTNFPVGPGAGTVTTSTITVTDNINVNDINVTLNINHTWVSDLEIKLVGPDNTEVVLVDGEGGDGDNFINTTFDDEASQSIVGATAPFTGSFQPQGNLSDFNGMMSAGDWDLVITDNVNQDGGQLNDWTLQICGAEILDAGNLNFPDGSQLVVIDQGSDQYKLLMNTSEVTNTLLVTVMDMSGKKLSVFPIDNETGRGYEHILDMSYVSSGIYLISLGDTNFTSVKRIIVR